MLTKTSYSFQILHLLYHLQIGIADRLILWAIHTYQRQYIQIRPLLCYRNINSQLFKEFIFLVLWLRRIYLNYPRTFASTDQMLHYWLCGILCIHLNVACIHEEQLVISNAILVLTFANWIADRLILWAIYTYQRRYIQIGSLLCHININS